MYFDALELEPPPMMQGHYLMILYSQPGSVPPPVAGVTVTWDFDRFEPASDCCLTSFEAGEEL